MCWAQVRAGDSVDSKWAWSYLLCTGPPPPPFPNRKYGPPEYFVTIMQFQVRQYRLSDLSSSLFVLLLNPWRKCDIWSLCKPALLFPELSRMWANGAPLIGFGFAVGGETSLPGGPFSNTARRRCWFIQLLPRGLNDPGENLSHFPAVWGQTGLALLTPLSPRVLDDTGDSIMTDTWYS